ncbi:MAG: hypothetical protein IKQ16_01900 [Lentisphaeria bacterium]|nr:hypothetical protein [Lentisphaeria bacterium]
MNRENCRAFLCPSAAGHNFSGGFASRVRHAVFPLVFAALPLLVQSCALFEDAEPEPDTVSETRSELIIAAGGFICLYREGANPVDLLYVKSTANEAGLQVIFKIAESSVIPEAIRKGWGDVAIGFTEAEAKKLGLRTVPLPRAENELREDAGTNVILLRSADDFLDALLNPDKRNKPSSDLNTTIPEL